MASTYQFKIEIEGSDPAIWRRVHVDSEIFFSDFNDIIHIAFQIASDSDDHEFLINKVRIADFGPEIDNGQNSELKDSFEVLLNEYINLTGMQFSYICDLEGQVIYNILLETIYPEGENIEHPRCIAGEKASLPEGLDIMTYQNIIDGTTTKINIHQNANDLLGPNFDPSHFDINKVNEELRQYAEEWEGIYNDAENVIGNLIDEEGNHLAEEESGHEYFNEDYERVKHFIKPEDVLNDEEEKSSIENWLKNFLDDKSSIEFKHYKRLLDQGFTEREAKNLLLNCVAIEWFYEIKYAKIHDDERYTSNLNKLPDKPVELPNLDSVIKTLKSSHKGIPFTAIEYLLHHDSKEATEAIINALKNYSDHKYCWSNCEMAPVWYAMAAEGHLHEALIEPVIQLCEENCNESQFLLEQAQYLIGKLAMQYPDLTAEKVLDAMENDTKQRTDNFLFFLFDCFYFCDISKHKERLVSLLKNHDISWHEPLVSTLSFLQVKEALPILKQQLEALQEKEPEKNYIEYKEAIMELETGEIKYPEVEMPVCLKPRGTLREEWAPVEEEFYPDGYNYEEEEYFEDRARDRGLDGRWSLTAATDPVSVGEKIGRNDPCPCGSGKKYKKCCLGKEE